jgi:hypothetical protein
MVKTVVPGVVSIESEIQRQKKIELEIHTKAAIVVQKWARGFFARKLARRVRDRRAHEIDAEYGYFNQ